MSEVVEVCDEGVWRGRLETRDPEFECAWEAAFGVIGSEEGLDGVGDGFGLHSERTREWVERREVGTGLEEEDAGVEGRRRRGGGRTVGERRRRSSSRRRGGGRGG